MSAAAETLIKPRPRVNKAQAREILLREFGVEAAPRDAAISAVDSYEDVNFLARGSRRIDETGDAAASDYVVKFHNSVDSAPDGGLQTIKAQEMVLEAVAHAVVPKQFCPGKHVVVDGETYYVRVLSYIPGRLLCEEPAPQPRVLLEEFGRTLGALDADLLGFSHPGAKRYLIWDLRNALETVRQFRSAVRKEDENRLIDEAVGTIASQVSAYSGGLRVSTIHGDANDHNVIIDANHTPQAIGLIDFGDLVESWIAAEVAIAMAYIMVAEPGADRKLAQARHFLRGYQESLPLEAAEVKALYGLIVARLATSVCISATDSERNPENAEYTLVHAQGAWDTLRFLLRTLGPAAGPLLFAD